VIREIITAAGLAVVGVGCSQLPAAAPTALEIVHPGPEDRARLDYLLVDLDAQVVHALASYRSPGLAATFGVGVYHPTLQLQVGDSVAITIFEVGTSLLFGPSEKAQSPTGSAASAPLLPTPGSQTVGNAITLPPQIIDVNGKVEVPYAGLVRVAGLTPEQADVAITQALQGLAPQPQVIVTRVVVGHNLVTVSGDVGHPGTIVLTLRGERILDVIAEGGGPKYEPYATDIQLIRKGVNATVRLQRILDDPRENISVQPGDQIFVMYDPWKFAVMGSAKSVAQYDFTARKMTLADAIARAGGAVDIAGDVGGVFLFRFEPKALAERFLAPSDPRRAVLAKLDASARVPVVFQINLRQPSAYFFAADAQLRNKDLLLVTNAGATQLDKLLATIRGFTGIYFDIKRTTVVQ
jgi:polysaccharide export outer membrane protein